jgi:hypothetical protein
MSSGAEALAGRKPEPVPKMRMNTDRQKPLSPSTYRAWMQRWLETCDVRDEHRRPTHLTPGPACALRTAIGEDADAGTARLQDDQIG